MASTQTETITQPLIPIAVSDDSQPSQAKTNLTVVFGAMTLGKEGTSLSTWFIPRINTLNQSQVPKELASILLKTLRPSSMFSNSTVTMRSTLHVFTERPKLCSDSSIGKHVASSWTPSSILAAWALISTHTRRKTSSVACWTVSRL